MSYRTTIILFPLVFLLAHGCTGSAAGDGDGSVNLCGCKQDTDELSNSACTKRQSACDALTPCDDGYTCNSALQCECVDLTRCGLQCTQDCECPTSLSCDANTSTCRVPLLCLGDSMCEEGELCSELSESPRTYRCVIAGSAETGDDCSSSLDCRSGTCLDSVCHQSCVAHSNCPVGQYCDVQMGGRGACVVQTGCALCTSPEEICDGTVCDEFCTSSSECPGDCGLVPDSPYQGYCIPILDGVCAPDEFLVISAIQDVCGVHVACWNPQDCPQGYECTPTSELVATVPGDPSLCTRMP